MQTLISCVGDTDPIRNYHDGPLLHIARVMRPNKIILIHSERSKTKNDNIVQAIQAIHEDYHPEILVDDYTLLDNEVFIFDRMYDVLNDIIKKYKQTETEIILNLTSATPQIISSMFAINNISELNVRAFQVVTPSHNSNEGIGHETKEDIASLIALNADNEPDFENRLREVQNEKFANSLMKRTMRDLIENYEYLGAYEIIKTGRIFTTDQDKLNKQLKTISETLKFQKVFPTVEKLKYEKTIKQLLNAYLIIDIQAKRELVSESLVRMKNFSEIAAATYLMDKYAGLISVNRERTKYFLDSKRDQTVLDKLESNARQKDRDFYANQSLNLSMYIQILEYKEPDSPFTKYLTKINTVSDLRNSVAHGINEIDGSRINLPFMTNTCRKLLEEIHPIDVKWFNFKEDLNAELISYLM